MASLDELRREQPLWPPMSLDTWKDQGKPSAEKELIATTMELYSKAQQNTKEQKELVLEGEQFFKDMANGRE